MSTRQRLPFAIIGLVAVLFALTMLPAFLREPQEWYVPDADAGMRKNASNQVVCAHLNTTAGASHTTGTTTVYYHPNATAQTTAGTAAHVANGVWCYTVDDAAEVNADIVKLAWVNTGAVTVLQSYLTTGYDDSAAYVPANLTHVNGTASTSSTALVGVTVNAMANDTVTAGAIAADAIGASELAANAIGATEIAAGAIGATQIADDAIDAGAIAAGAITSSEAGALDVAVSSRLATAGYTAPPTAADNADAVWDEALAGHAGAGSAGAALSAASAGGGLDAAGVRAAVGLASANLDTQLAGLGTVLTKLDTTLVQDGAVWDFTAPALEAAPTGGSAPTVGEIADEWDARHDADLDAILEGTGSDTGVTVE